MKRDHSNEYSQHHLTSAGTVWFNMYLVLTFRAVDETLLIATVHCKGSYCVVISCDAAYVTVQ